MQIKTILNRVQKFKSFVYGTVRWIEGATLLEQLGDGSRTAVLAIGAERGAWCHILWT